MRFAFHATTALAAVALAVGLAGPADAQQSRTLKMQSSFPANSTAHDAFKMLAERVEKLSGGQLKIDAAPGGQIVPPFEVLDADGCIRAEPGLARSRAKIAGGLRLPEDETGDCFKFTNSLEKLAKAAGVTFRYGVSIDRLEAAGGKVVAVHTSEGRVTADSFVLALGSFSPLLARPLGIKLPVYPVKGYSITVPIVNASLAPESTIMDESYKIAITRLGDRIRVGGMAEIAGFDNTLHEKRRLTLQHSVEDLFGGAGDQKASTFWCGLRPMTPDGTPVVGRSPIPNLFLNTGHGTLGWTMAAGSGRLLADLMSEQSGDIESADLGYGRYQRLAA